MDHVLLSGYPAGNVARLWEAVKSAHIEPGNLGEYAQLFLMIGEDEANDAFPQIGAHLVECEECSHDFAGLCDELSAKLDLV